MKVTSYRFSRKYGEILTNGIDPSGKLTSEHTNGQYEVWKKHSGTFWKSRLQPQAYSPTQYWIVKITGEEFELIKNITPGRKVKLVKAELYDECDKLGGVEL